MANQGTPKPVASNKGRLRGKPSVPPPTPKGVKLLVTIVSRNKAEFYMDLLQSLEVNVQLALSGYGTASTDMLQLLGLADSEKSVIFSMVREDRAREALSLLGEKFKTVRGGKGIAYTIPFKSVIGVQIYRFLTNNRMPINAKGE
ncbi:MAG: hypothetical protein IKW66_00615 [Clostridia bacterium]|nr:hypothetical protein [Clostridia bacterium]